MADKTKEKREKELLDIDQGRDYDRSTKTSAELDEIAYAEAQDDAFETNRLAAVLEQQQERREQAAAQQVQKTQQATQNRNRLRDDRMERDRKAEQTLQRNKQQQKTNEKQKESAQQRRTAAMKRAEDRRKQRDQGLEINDEPVNRPRERGPRKDREDEPTRDWQGKEVKEPAGDLKYRGPIMMQAKWTSTGFYDVSPDGRVLMTDFRDLATEKAKDGCSLEQVMEVAGWDSNRGEQGEKAKWYADLCKQYNCRSWNDEKGETAQWWKDRVAKLDAESIALGKELNGTKESNTPKAEIIKNRDVAVATQAMKGGAEKNAPAPEQKQEAVKAPEQARPAQPRKLDIAAMGKRVIEAAAKEAGIDLSKIPAPVAIPERTAPTGQKSALAEKLEKTAPVVEGFATVLKAEQKQNEAEPIPGDRSRDELKPKAQEEQTPVLGEDLRGLGHEAREGNKWETQVYTEGNWVNAVENREFRHTASGSQRLQSVPEPVAEQNPSEVRQDKLPTGSAWVDHDKGVYLQKQPEFRYSTNFQNPGLRAQTVDVVRPVREVKTKAGLERQTYLAETKSWVKSDDHNASVKDYLDAHRQEQPELSAEQKREQGVGRAWHRAIELGKGGLREVYVSRDNGTKTANRNPKDEAPWVQKTDRAYKSVSQQFRDNYVRQGKLPERTAEYERTLNQPSREAVKEAPASEKLVETAKTAEITKSQQVQTPDKTAEKTEKTVQEKPESMLEEIIRQSRTTSAPAQDQEQGRDLGGR